MIQGLKEIFKKYFTIKRVVPTTVPVFQGQFLKDKVSLIIGGSGGIGSQIAKQFAKNGSKIMLVGTNKQKLEEICTAIGKDISNNMVIDLRNVEVFHQVIDETLATFGKIDILVHCAGVHCEESFGSVTESTWDKVIDINLKSMFFMSQQVANYMISNNVKGHILHVGSASAAKPGWTPYEISKIGVKSLTLGFADKLIKYGIVVNSIAPGPVATPMLKKHDVSDIAWPGNPTGRMCVPEEIANWALFMVSDMGNMVIGDTLYVSGGSGTICIDK